jgi:hypothetical protein
MKQAKKNGRFGRLLQSTCLAAGLATLALASAPVPALAQGPENAFSALSPDPATDPAVTATGTALADTGEDGQTNGRRLRLKNGDDAVPVEETEALNARATPIPGDDGASLTDGADIEGRDNLRTPPVDEIRPRLPLVSTDSPGIRLGTFVLRPSLTNSIGNETNRSQGNSVSRTYGQTELKGTLTSDWSRHQLTITGDGAYQKNISGEGQTDPSLEIDADLRLDLPAETTAHLTAGYALSRESATDPNAVLGAIDQSAVQTLSAGASLERSLGLLRGLAALDVSRSTYGDVTLSDGSKASVDDRDRNTATLRGRIGYELSPALIPFLEASIGRTVYDENRDARGYRRDAESLSGKAGVEVDLGEKLKGELGLGYKHVSFADARLAAIDAVVLDAAANWSPRRGTDITLGLATTVEPSFVAGQSGYINRALTLALSHELRANLVGRVNGGLVWRDYRPKGATADELVTTIGTGFTYGINRYVDLTGDISWERTTPDRGEDFDVLRAGLGLTLKR